MPDHHRSELQRQDERYGSTRVIRRSRLFFVTPIIAIAMLSFNMAWEIIRANVNTHALSEWPLRFTILNISTTATVLSVFAGLFMGRLQWARTLRPYVGSAIDDEGAVFEIQSEKWRFWVYNAGPGGAVIDEVKYHVQFADQPEAGSDPDWVSLSVVNDQFKSRGLRDGVDYFMRWHAASSPFPVAKGYIEGKDIGWFSIIALIQLRILDVRIRFSDTLGDAYEKVIPVMHRLPSVTLTAINLEKSKNRKTK